ncbi:hypothetical protein ACH4KO_09345 [Streptomyces anulatus]
MTRRYDSTTAVSANDTPPDAQALCRRRGSRRGSDRGSPRPRPAEPFAAPVALGLAALPVRRRLLGAGADAAEWLSEHGAGYGLCQIYRNEPWPYELRTEAIDRGCPRMYADPTQDPRMRP